MSGTLGNLVVKLTLELKEYRAKLQEAARDTQQSMAEAGRATEGLDTHTKKLGQTAGTTAKQVGQMAEAVVKGDYAGVAQKMGQMATQATAVGAGVSAMAVGVGTAVVALTAYAVIAQKASEEQARQANVMALTGNAAGLLTGQMNDMARSVAASTQSAVGNSRKIVEGLVSTGRVGRVALQDMAAAVELVAQATGKTRETVVSEFEGMADGVAKWAAKHNETYHFLTYEQYQYIKALEDAGRAQEAMQATSEALRRHLAGVPDNLGILQRAWRAVGNAAGWAWDKMLDLGRTQTTADKLTDVTNQVAYAREKLENAKSKGFSAGVIEKARQELELALQNQSLLQEQERLERRSADAQAASAKATQDKITADEQWNRTATNTRSSQQRLADALADVRKNGELLGKSEAEIRDMQDQVRASMETRTRATKGLTEAEREAMEQRKRDMKVVELRNKAVQEAAEAEARYQATRDAENFDAAWAADQKALKVSNDRIKAARLMHEALQNEIRLQGMSAKERQVATAMLELERQGVVKGTEAYNAYAQKIRDAIEIKVANDEHIRMWESIDQTAHDVFVSVAKDGVSAFKRIGDTLQSAVLDALYQMTVKRWIVSIAAQVSGSGSVGGSQEGGGGSGSGLSNAYSLMSNGGTALSLGSQWASGTMSTANVYGTVWGNSTGTGIDGLLATNGAYGTAPASAGGFGSYMPAVGGAIGAYGFGKQYGFAGGMLGGASSAALAGGIGGMVSGAGFMSGASGALAGLGPWGWAAMAIMAILGSMDDSGTYHAGGAGSAGPSGVRQGVTAESLGMASTVVADAATKAMEETAASMAAMFNGLGRGDFNVSTAFADDSSKDGAWGALRIERDGQKLLDWADTQTSRWAPKEFADGDKGLQQYTAALAVSVRDALEEIGLPGWATGMLEALGDAPTFEQISGVMQSITVVDQTMETLGQGMAAFADISDETVTALAEATGGIANLQAGLGYFFQEFFTETERLDIATKQTTAGLAELGQEMPTSRAAFREMVNVALEAGDSELVAGLLSFSGAIASILPATEDATAALEQQADAARSATDAALDALQRSVAAEQNRLRTAASVASESVSSLTGLINTIKGGIDALYSGVESVAAQRAAQGKAFISQALATARVSGYLPESAALGDAISAVTADPTQYANSTAAAYERLKTAGQLAELSELGGEQLDTASRQLRALQDQIDQNDRLLDFARTQIDVLRGVDTSVLSVAEAMQKFYDRTFEEGAFAPETTAAGSGTGSSGGGKFVVGGGGGGGVMYDTQGDRLAADIAAYEAAGKAYRVVYLPGVGPVISAASGEQQPLTDVQEEWLRNAGVPGFDVGTDYVPRDMLARIHEGEQIVPKAYNPHANAQLASAGNDELVRLLGAVLQVMSRNAEFSGQVADVLTRVTRNGNAMVTTPAPI